MKSGGHIPLISPWLNRLDVWRTVRRVTDGDMHAVRNLAAVFCTSPDSSVRDLAARGIRSLKSPGQIDLLCRECILRDNNILTAVATVCGYLPAAPADRALWFFCTSAPDRLRELDTRDHFPLLAAGYTAAEEVVRARARDTARRDNTCSILARALSGPGVTRNAAGWSFWEWEVVIRGFSSERRWNDLWLLVSLAPLPLCMDAVRSLQSAGWSPPGDDRALWEDLVLSLPDRWVYPLHAGEPRDPVGRPAGQVARHCFSADGSLLATGCCDGMITVWRTTSAGLMTEFLAGAGSISFLAIPVDNTRLFSAGDDGTVRCNRLEDGSLLWSWKDRGLGAVIALSADGHTVLAGDSDGCLHLIDGLNGGVLDTIPLHPSPVTYLAPAPAGPAIVCGHADGTISLARPDGGTSPLILPGNSSPVHALSFSRSAAEILAIYERGHPVRWDIADGKKLSVFTGHTGRTICSAMPAAGEWFGIGGDDHTFRCWDLVKSAPAMVIPVYSRHITSCSAAPDGSLLAMGFHDGSIRLYSMPGGVLVREYKGHKKTVTSCMIAPGGSRLATVSWDKTTKLWRVPEGEIVRTFDTYTGSIAALAGPAGTLLATVTENGIARILDSADGRIIRSIDLYTPSVRAAAVTPDGTYLAITGADSSVRCWNIRDGSLTAAGDRQAASLRCCAFLADNSTLVTGGWDGSCRFFSLPDMTPLRTLTGHSSIVTCCTVSRDGSLLVTGSNDTTVRLSRIAEDEAYAVLRESRSEVGAVALSPDGTLLAAGNSDGIIRLYRLPYGTPERGLPDLPGKVVSLVFSADGCILAASYGTGTIALFSLPERSLIRTIPAHSGPVTGLALLPGGKMLVSTGADGICRFHALPCPPFLVHAGLADIPSVVPGENPAAVPGKNTGSFHRALLAARFKGEIGICLPPDRAGCYDIQLAG